MLLTEAATAGDVLRLAHCRRRHRECVRILIIIAFLACCRRGRAAMRKVVSPFSFVLWCVGLNQRHFRNGNSVSLPGRTQSQVQPQPQPLTRRVFVWTGAFRRSGSRREDIDAGAGGGEGGDGREGCGNLLGMQTEGSARSRLVRLATLGERGRRLAFGHFRQLQRDGACCDVSLLVGGTIFKAHKCVLAAQSSPLCAMFEGSFKEGSAERISLLDVEPSSFSQLLDFLYGRSVEINGENVEALLDLSARYGVSLLRWHCCAFMAGSASPSTVCSLLAVADRYDCHRLRRELLAYTLGCFTLACSESSSDGGFRHLSLSLVAEVLQDDRLAAAEGEVAVFWAAVSWLEAEQSRRRSADDILSHVRFGRISAKTLAEVVETHPLMQSQAGKAFVHEAYRYQALPPDSRSNFASSMAARARPRDPRPSHPSISVGSGGGCGGGGHRTGLRNVEFVDEEGASRYKGSEDMWVMGGREDEVDGGEGCRVAVGVQEVGGWPVGATNDALAAQVPGGAQTTIEGEEAGGRGSGGAGYDSPRKSHATAAKTRRSPWGAGLRMYV